MILTILQHHTVANVTTIAQLASVQLGFWSDPLRDPLLPLYFIATFIVALILLVGLVVYYVIKVLTILTVETAKEKAKKLGLSYTPEPTWWDKFIKHVNASVPVEHEKDIEMDHSYDGIKELDNHLPPWWKWLFYGTIGWGVVYIIVFHVSNMLPLQQEEYNHELSVAEIQIREFKASQPQEEIDESNIVFNADPAIIEKGKSIFMNMNCVACHRSDGGGNGIGPNLTDDYWLHGANGKQIFHTIKNGVVEKGMPAWGKTMSAKDVRNVTFFVMSLRGSNPANPKAPQGELFKDVPVVVDSVQARASL